MLSAIDRHRKITGAVFFALAIGSLYLGVALVKDRVELIISIVLSVNLLVWAVGFLMKGLVTAIRFGMYPLTITLICSIILGACYLFGMTLDSIQKLSGIVGAFVSVILFQVFPIPKMVSEYAQQLLKDGMSQKHELNQNDDYASNYETEYLHNFGDEKLEDEYTSVDYYFELYEEHGNSDDTGLDLIEQYYEYVPKKFQLESLSPIGRIIRIVLGVLILIISLVAMVIGFWNEDSESNLYVYLLLGGVFGLFFGLGIFIAGFLKGFLFPILLIAFGGLLSACYFGAKFAFDVSVLIGISVTMIEVICISIGFTKLIKALAERKPFAPSTEFRLKSELVRTRKIPQLQELIAVFESQPEYAYDFTGSDWYFNRVGFVLIRDNGELFFIMEAASGNFQFIHVQDGLKVSRLDLKMVEEFAIKFVNGTEFIYLTYGAERIKTAKIITKPYIEILPIAEP